MPSRRRDCRSSSAHQHAPHNAMADAGEVARFYDRCSDLMRELLDALADAPEQPRPLPEIEDATGAAGPTASTPTESPRPAAGRSGWTPDRRERCGPRAEARAQPLPSPDS